ncbi:hypothetical protein ACFPDQ_02685 [Pseudofrancisella aestuarii]|uniref:Uncharacterized protein n=1 Tax=Pseudofrancisella aestuarii TaxID=2670347 RepID=A0ABV9TB04_9GAMM|nr:hypothetical protein [Pseudofrancisella aestuarii]
MSKGNIPEWSKRRDKIKKEKDFIRVKNSFLDNLNSFLAKTLVFNFLYILLSIYLYAAYDMRFYLNHSTNTNFFLSILYILAMVVLYYICYLRAKKLGRKSIFILVLLSDVISFMHEFNLFIFIIELLLGLAALIIANIKLKDEPSDDPIFK